MRDQRLRELDAAVDDDVAVGLLLELGDPASTRSPAWMTVEFVHSGSVSVEETTYLGIELNRSANSPSRDGQAAAKPS